MTSQGLVVEMTVEYFDLTPMDTDVRHQPYTRPMLSHDWSCLWVLQGGRQYSA